MNEAPTDRRETADRNPRDIAATWLRIIAAALIVGVIMALSGGFGVGGATIVSRLAYWLLLVAIGSTVGVLVGVYVMPRAWFARRPWLVWMAIVLVLWPPMILIVMVANTLVEHTPFSMAVALKVAPSTLATTAAMTALAFLVRRREPIETHGRANGAPPPRFIGRLPAKLAHSELWAVEAEDHYLRLHTSLGQDLILMRLGDAIAELEGIEGARTHRSWWVARAAVQRVEREDGRARLVLPDGAEAPVSRAYVKTLRATGWF
ncbi:MAG TPA: LytTR family DNA-binding domain-containing protein [Caulobacteraceae bacterium]|nr:LytTR family DNA-binding domain-containing protein [Caulobacteraceae bacterium]